MGCDFWTILFYIHRSYNNHLHISSSETTMLLHCHAHVLSILLVTWSSFLGVLSKLFTFQNSFVCGFFWSNLSPLLSLSLHHCSPAHLILILCFLSDSCHLSVAVLSIRPFASASVLLLSFARQVQFIPQVLLSNKFVRKHFTQKHKYR